MLVAKKTKVASRGASPRRSEAPSRQFPWARLAAIAVSTLVAGVLVLVYQGLRELMDVPVSRVVIKGEFRHVSRDQLELELLAQLQSGFMTLDLQSIQRQLEAQPWIYQARVRRQWPDYLQIDIAEQSAIARWGRDAYLNHRGEMFRPEPMVELEGLALLSGPDEQAYRVMKRYRNLSEALAKNDLSLLRLSLNERGAWRALIDGDVELVLGADQVMEKIQRFLRVYQADLEQQFDRVARVDMRYSNGLAVAWREQVQKG